MGEQSSRADERFLIGTCGYSYPGDSPKGWNGVFYLKAGRKRVDELEFYSSCFRAVEINSTFYRPPSAQMANAWVNRTPNEFVFAVKAWQKFTHTMKLGGDISSSGKHWERFDNDDVNLFIDDIAPLADAGRLGALLFQYPAGFVRNPENLERLEAGLSAFDLCPKVVELRHRSWSDQHDETQALLERLGAAWAFIDEPKFSTSVKQDLTVSDELAYLRLHGRNQQKWWKHEDAWERYDYFYRADAIRRLAERLKKIPGASPQTKFYVFFNNHARGQAVANALMLQSALAPSVRARAPQALIEAFPELRNFVAGAELEDLESCSF
ncbi:MAG TPA: DUF72 domain-containing protein [Candidatus Binatia bacterium]|nr:DUF72 domain-containing protein [Candidatus Binatia bacterium]